MSKNQVWRLFNWTVELIFYHNFQQNKLKTNPWAISWIFGKSHLRQNIFSNCTCSLWMLYKIQTILSPNRLKSFFKKSGFAQNVFFSLVLKKPRVPQWKKKVFSSRILLQHKSSTCDLKFSGWRVFVRNKIVIKLFDFFFFS